MNRRYSRKKKAIRNVICVLIATLLSIALTSASQKPQESTACLNVGVAIVIDVSGSMDYHWSDGLKIDSAKNAALDLLRLIKIENDRSEVSYHAALIVFSKEARVVQSISSNFSLLENKVRELTVDGGTNIGDGLEKAYNQLELMKFDRSYVVFLSDGVTNVGRSSAEILDWLRNKHQRLEPKDLRPQASVYGFDYKDGVNTIDRARFASDSLRKAGYDVQFINEFQWKDENSQVKNSKDFAMKRLYEDNFFAFNGHANYNFLSFRILQNDKLEHDRLSTNDLDKYQLNLLKLAILAGCKTASKLNNHDNISHAFVKQGAQSSMGFMDYVNNHGMMAWLEYFYIHLLAIDRPKSVCDAYRLAVSDYDFQLYRVSGGIKTFGYQYYYAILPQLYCQNDTPVYIVETASDVPEIKEPDDSKPRIYTIGLGNQDHFDENLLRNIAQVTDGKYFHGAQSFGLTNSFVSTQHHGTGKVVSEFEGQISPDETLSAGKIYLDKRQDDLRISLNWPGSHIDLQLIDPTGKIVDENYRGLKVWRSERPAYLVLERPKEGEWSVMLHGKDVSLDGTSYYVVASVGDVVAKAYNEFLFFLVVHALLVLIGLLLSPKLFGKRELVLKKAKR